LLITLLNTYFESIAEWLPEALGLYRIIFDAVYGSLILSLLLFTLGNMYHYADSQPLTQGKKK